MVRMPHMSPSTRNTLQSLVPHSAAVAVYTPIEAVSRVQRLWDDCLRHGCTAMCRRAGSSSWSCDRSAHRHVLGRQERRAGLTWARLSLGCSLDGRSTKIGRGCQRLSNLSPGVAMWMHPRRVMGLGKLGPTPQSSISTASGVTSTRPTRQVAIANLAPCTLRLADTAALHRLQRRFLCPTR
jgi:hypothetical protein